MNKNNKNKFIPKLRFPKFKNDGEWSYPNGDELFEPIVNKNHNSDLPILAITQEQGAIPREMIDYHVSVTDKSVESYKVVEVGDFIISLRSFQGGIEYSNYKGLCSPAYIILRKKADLVNDFYRHYFKSVPFIRDLNKNLEGIRDGKMISYKQFSEILIPKPSSNEQQKIATCLSSLDEVITTESQKLEILKEHKKGLLQNMLPQEGETVPKFRFKEFEESGEWEDYTIETIGEVVTGGTPSKENKEYWGGDFVWITAQDFKGKYITDSVLKLTQKGKEKSRIIPKDSVLVTCIASIGLNGINKVECATNQQINSVVCNSESHYEFVYYSITQNGNRLKNLAGQTAVPIINKSVFEKFIIQKPRYYQEQQKIAETLSSIDDLINAQSQKVDFLKLHKKGLLQGLFPMISNEE